MQAKASANGQLNSRKFKLFQPQQACTGVVAALTRIVIAHNLFQLE
jgi:hypothetical protein